MGILLLRKQEGDQVRWNVSRKRLQAMLLEILSLPRSSYYCHIKQLKQVDKNKVLKAKIKMIYDEHKGNYGYRRITLELRN